ncbi:MAG: hypothetical protein PHD67_04300 [Oscillospiraceae bacterium]|nr:hypothetical protein [Oscillospiraceae bacterium]
MKKLLSVVLVLAMCAGLGVTALAKAEDPSYNLPPFDDEEFAYSTADEEAEYGYGDEYFCFAYYHLNKAEGERFQDYKVSYSIQEGAESIKEINIYKYDYVSSSRDVDLGIKFKDAYPTEPIRVKAKVKFLTTKGKNITSQIYDQDHVYEDVCKFDEKEKVILIDFLYGFNKNVQMYAENMINGDGEVEYEDFDNNSTISEQGGTYEYLSPVLDFDQFENNATNLYMTFAGTDVSFEAKLAGQDPVNMYYDTYANKAIGQEYEENDLNFMNFKAKPEFDFSGTLTWYVPDEDKTWYLYEINEDDTLKATNAVYNEEDVCFTLKARTLGSYLLMDGEGKVVEPEKEEDKTNPETGSGFLAAAVALAAWAK